MSSAQLSCGPKEFRVVIERPSVFVLVLGTLFTFCVDFYWFGQSVAIQNTKETKNIQCIFEINPWF